MLLMKHYNADRICGDQTQASVKTKGRRQDTQSSTEGDKEEKNSTSFDLQKRLQEMAARHHSKAKTTSKLKPTSDEQSKQSEKPKTIQRKQGRRRSSLSYIEKAQLTLIQLEQEGRFTTYPIIPSTEYPTFLTRLPIFIPGQRRSQQRVLDNDNALPFTTSWGEGRKHGPPLTVYDEDTLIAIGRLRQNLLIGSPHKLPVPISELYRAVGEDSVHVHVVQCMLSDIQNVCGTSRGGKNDRMRMDSIKRLAATVIEFTTKTADKFTGKGTEIKLIDVAWQEYEENAILYIQLTPVMAAWFEKEYTYIDWDLRCKLTDTGKAVHRFLSSQGREYEIYTKKLMTTIGYLRGYKKFMADLRVVMEQLKVEKWISEHQIIGSGRKVPHKLIIKRKKS
jgi:hypothetical protein